jgi:hypothetical protein
MAQPQSAIQNSPVTSYITVSSLDRYSNGVPPPVGSSQTTCADITFPLPSLSNMATAQVFAISATNSNWWNQVSQNAVSVAFYTNIINLVDLTTGQTFLVTVPENSGAITAVISNLGKYVQASAFGGTAAGFVPSFFTGVSSAANSIYDPISGPAGLWWIWYDSARTAATTHSFGWSRVTTAPDGTNIANRRQLFDILGCAGHVPSVAGLGLPGAGYTTIPFNPSAGNVLGPVRYIDFISPQLTNFAPDVFTNSNASSNSLARLSNINLLTSSFPGSGLAGKVMKVQPGATSLRVQIVDDQQNLIPTNFPVPIPFQAALPTGTGILSTTLSNLTFSGISNANVNFPTGTQVNILTALSSPPAGWNPGVYRVESSTSNTVVIPYLTTTASQISNASYTFTIMPVWRYSLTGNQNGPEYQLVFSAIARTTTA